MRVCPVNFSDEESLVVIKKYCIESSPFVEMDVNKSISFRAIAAEGFIRSLDEDCRLSIRCVSDELEDLFFAFFKKNNNEEIVLHFAMPNTNLKQSPSEMRDCFYKLCLYALDKLKVDKIKGKVIRISKKNSYKLFLKRYIKAMTYQENKDSDYDSVYLTRKSIEDHCEKLKVSSNRDELNNKAS